MTSPSTDPGDLMERARSSARDAASNATDKAGEYGQQVMDKAREWWPSIQRSLKDQPLTTLAGVAAVGFVLGAIMRR